MENPPKRSTPFNGACSPRATVVLAVVTEMPWDASKEDSVTRNSSGLSSHQTSSLLSRIYYIVYYIIFFQYLVTVLQYLVLLNRFKRSFWNGGPEAMPNAKGFVPCGATAPCPIRQRLRAVV